MIEIQVSDQFKKSCPEFRGIGILANVANSSYDEALWKRIDDEIMTYKEKHLLEDVKSNPAILATRDAYKRLGKDPNRYRPSSEALCRRIVRGLPLYQIDTLVDIINLVSIKTGYSIGGFDVDKLNGDTLVLGVGCADEPYEGIGRGLLNIERLPVYRDALGGVGTPTSDNERTKLDVNTKRLLVIVNSYDGDVSALSRAIDYLKPLLEEFAKASQFEEIIF